MSKLSSGDRIIATAMHGQVQTRMYLTQIPVAIYARGVCVDLNGLVYVSCGGSHVVQIFDPRYNYS